MAKNKRKNRGRKTLVTILIVVAVLIAVGAVAIKILRERVTAAYGQKSTTEILSTTVSRGSISTTISGSGVLSQQEATAVSVPSGVAIQSLRVAKDDVVQEGDKLANVNMPTVLTAMNTMQGKLDELDEQIADAAKDTVDTYLRSTVKGRVKQIFCKEGDSVLSVMYEHGALMTLSLDGRLAFEIPAGSLSAGDAVTVVLSDGSEYAGTVESAEETATVLITDDKPSVGDTATAFDADKNELGTGELYIHQPLSITGYAGTVGRVNVTENRSVSARTLLLTLKDTAFTANYESLLDERAALEAQFNELVQLYKAGAVYAPVAGKISVLTETESAENEADSWTLLEIVPQEKMIVSASVDESDILAVSTGQEASVVISSIGDDAFTGEVTAIEKTGTSYNGVTTYAVEVTLDRTASMYPNMSATVSVRIEGVDDALIVTEKAVTKTRDSAYVYTSVDESTGELSGRIEVSTGLSGGGYIEITEGLNEGDTVYYTETETNDFSMFMSGFGGGFGGGTGGNSGGMPSFGGSSGGNSGGMPSFGGGAGGNFGDSGSRPSGSGSGSSRRRNGGD